MDGFFWKFVGYEPRLERQLGERGAATDNLRAKRTHYPNGAAP